MAGRAGRPDRERTLRGDRLLPATADNGFNPALPERHVDLIYLCYPNNPTGAVLGKDALKRWVDYARREGAVILYDAAYESYIRDPAIPRSIYEIEGAQEVAIELRSSPRRRASPGSAARIPWCPRTAWAGPRRARRRACNALWFRRQSTKFNGGVLHHPEGRRRGVLAGGPEAGARVGRLLPRERPHHPRGRGGHRASPSTAAPTRRTSG